MFSCISHNCFCCSFFATTQELTLAMYPQEARNCPDVIFSKFKSYVSFLNQVLNNHLNINSLFQLFDQIHLVAWSTS